MYLSFPNISRDDIKPVKCPSAPCQYFQKPKSVRPALGRRWQNLERIFYGSGDTTRKQNFEYRPLHWWRGTIRDGVRSGEMTTRAVTVARRIVCVQRTYACRVMYSDVGLCILGQRTSLSVRYSVSDRDSTGVRCRATVCQSTAWFAASDWRTNDVTVMTYEWRHCHATKIVPGSTVSASSTPSKR